MKIVQQVYGTGAVEVVDAPAPGPRPNGVLVANESSAVSAGTEAAMIGLARKSLLGKARARPDLVRQVMDKARMDGVLEAYRAARQRLDTPVPLGYSSAGTVLDVGQGAEEYQAGDRVACFGSGYASHAHVVWVPKTLVVPVPEAVDGVSAAFAGMGAIALHATRTLAPTVGDRVGVIGLGLLGLLSGQILRASGCTVVGVDINPERVRLAGDYGFHHLAASGDPARALALAITDGEGLDSVLVFAASESAEPLELAADLARRGATIAVPGLVDLHVPRRAFYEKELRLIVPRSAGAGVYDPDYARRGHDYPREHVPWTARRNMADFLGLVRDGAVKVAPLVTHRFPIDRAAEAYDLLITRREPFIGIALTYPVNAGTGDLAAHVGAQAPLAARTLSLPAAGRAAPVAGGIGVGAIGAGLFARGTLLPALKKVPGVTLRGLATATGTTARHAGGKFGFAYVTTDHRQVLDDADTRAVVVLTRHDQHAAIAAEALAKDKFVFVEKPLATSPEDLAKVLAAAKTSKGWLMVGFNRRFSPFTVEAAKGLRARTGPVLVHCRVNAGAVPRDSWVQDPVEGAGRVIGEVCHFVDLIHALTGSLTDHVYAQALPAKGIYAKDENVSITLTLTDGSVGTILYTAMGHRAFSRERVEVFHGGAVTLIENFRELQVHGAGGRRQRTRPPLWGMRRWNVDRGHQAEMEAFVRAVRDGSGPPVPLADYVTTTVATFAILESMGTGAPVQVSPRVADVLGRAR